MLYCTYPFKVLLQDFDEIHPLSATARRRIVLVLLEKMSQVHGGRGVPKVRRFGIPPTQLRRSSEEEEEEGRIRREGEDE